MAQDPQPTLWQQPGVRSADTCRGCTAWGSPALPCRDQLQGSSRAKIPI